jgi:hypothetical protein
MNLLIEREDVEALVRAIERTREIIATEPIASTVERKLLPARREAAGSRCRQPSRRRAVNPAHHERAVLLAETELVQRNPPSRLHNFRFGELAPRAPRHQLS